MWRDGIITHPTTKNKFKYWVKNFEEGSEFGIDGGRISKLTIKKYGESLDLVNYDRDWDIEPATEELKAVYAIILSKYN